jgi:multidrug resistance efflux pump
VRTPVAGFVKNVRVREGEHVHKGDVLATVAVPDVDRDIARVRHEIEAARALLAQAERGARPTELLMAQARERGAHTKALYLMRQRDRVARLARQGLESRQALDDANRDAETAQAEAELAALQVAHVEQGNAPEEIEQKRADVAKLEGERDFLQKQRGHAELIAPSDGVVATPRLSELESKYVAPGTEIMVVLDGRQMMFEVKVPEREIEFVRAGAPVRLRLKGDPQHPVEGVVEEIAPRVEEGPLGRVVPVRCRAAEVPPAALAGLSGSAQIQGPRTSWVGLLGKRIYRWVRTDLL